MGEYIAELCMKRPSSDEGRDNDGKPGNNELDEFLVKESCLFISNRIVEGWQTRGWSPKLVESDRILFISFE